MSSNKNKKPVYRSYLSSDSQYLKDTASKIKTKKPIEEIEFKLLNQALTRLGISKDPYKSVTIEEQNTPEVQKLVKESYKKLNLLNKKKQDKSQILALWDYLSESDPLIPADLIFTFGGQGAARIRESISLYKKNYAPKILFTGNKAAYMPTVSSTEADYYAEKAILSGISPNSLILEKEAINTVGNAVNSVKLLRKLKFLPKKIILINHNFQMKRSYLTFKTNAFWDPILIKHSVAGEKYTRQNFYKEFEGWSYVFYEYIKLYGARLMKHF